MSSFERAGFFAAAFEAFILSGSFFGGILLLGSAYQNVEYAGGVALLVFFHAMVSKRR
jgi:predicted MFS family arabinose efflux permease